MKEYEFVFTLCLKWIDGKIERVRVRRDWQRVRERESEGERSTESVRVRRNWEKEREREWATEKDRVWADKSCTAGYVNKRNHTTNYTLAILKRLSSETLAKAKTTWNRNERMNMKYSLSDFLVHFKKKGEYPFVLRDVSSYARLDSATKYSFFFSLSPHTLYSLLFSYTMFTYYLTACFLLCVFLHFSPFDILQFFSIISFMRWDLFQFSFRYEVSFSVSFQVLPNHAFHFD